MFSFHSIDHYHQSLKSGATTCVQAVQHYLSAIENNKELNAFIEVFTEEALERAAFLDGTPPTGPLHGVVIGIKDNICYAGHAATAASHILEGFESPYSATAVQRLLNAGAIIIGRQNCDEFGMGSTNEHSAYGPVLNPIDHDRVPGGSSGGSAAAVSAGLCMAALGSDTGGSVRLPADFCGIVGIKPAYGRVSRYGLIAYGSFFDQIGILARSVADAALIWETIAGPDEYDSTALTTQPSSPLPLAEDKKYRIAYFSEWLNHPSLDPEIAKALKQTIDKLKDEGHRVKAVPFALSDYIVPTYYILTTAEASSNLGRYDGVRYGRSAGPANSLASFYRQNRTQGFGKEVKRRILLGTFVLSAGYYDAYFTKAQQVRQQLKQQTELIFKDFDFIIAPNAPSVAYLIGAADRDPLAIYLGDIFTVFANLTGLPATSLPVFKHSSNLPFGLQVLSSTQNEVSLLRFSHHLMQQ